jgi:biotin carboxyl carrier protein
VDVQEGVRETRKIAAEPIKGAPEEAVSVKAPLPGVVVRIIAGEGDAINDGDTILVMEAMKMETEIKSPATGKITSITVGVGEKVQAGHILALIH